MEINMKKLLILGLLVVLLGACASGQTPKSPEDENKQKTEEKPKDNVSGEVIVREVFANEKDIRLTYLGIEEFPTAFGFVFLINNDNDFDIVVKTEDVVINGTIAWPSTERNIPYYETYDMVQPLFKDMLEVEDLVDKVDYIEMKFVVIKFETKEVLFRTPVIKIMYKPN